VINFLLSYWFTWLTLQILWVWDHVFYSCHSFFGLVLFKRFYNHLVLFHFFLELFELFDNYPALWCKEGIAEAVLSTYTWCFMQFTLVFTATANTVPDEARKKVRNTH